MKLFSALGVLLLASTSLVSAKSDPEIVERTPFEGRPDGLFYFEDSEVILTIDKGKGALYTSRNGGEDWAKAGDIDEGHATRIYLHPRDNKVAVVTGDNLDHWITEDQGKSWRKFTSEYPAHWADAISFHYSDSKKILFHTPPYQFTSVGKVCCVLNPFKVTI
jgi:photosystem II stability/assembly factor-like uncharacterized protein